MTNPVVPNMPRLGEVIAGRYRLDALLGQGGMGVVFEVTHTGLGRTFALKVLTAHLGVSEEHRNRFMREARVNASITHPNIVEIYDVGEHEGLLYTVMEKLEGVSMEGKLRARSLALEDALEYGAQIAEALAAAHEIGLVHRDVKPENVLVEEDEQGRERCVLVDFGLAFIRDSEELGRMTQADGTVSGTPLFMSPEQIGAEELTPSSDVYSLGCMLFELVCGRTPFEDYADNMAKLMMRHAFTPPPPLRDFSPEVPTPLEQLVASMLEKDPARRPDAARVAEVLRDLQRAPQQWGRGGALRSRSERMVEAATARAERHGSGTARMFAPQPVASEAEHVLGHVGVALDVDARAALTAEGVEAREVSQATAREVDVLLVPATSQAFIEDISSEVAVIAVTSPGDMERVAALLRAGAAGVLPEGFGPEDLVARVKRAIRRKRRGRRR